MASLTVPLQKIFGQVRASRVLQAIAFGAAVALLGITVWILRDRLFSSEPPPDFQQYAERAADPVVLGEFLSFESVEAVNQRLRAWGYSADVSQSYKPPSKRYPPRNLDSLDVTGFEHLGTRGRLRLEFFNDRLYEVHFEPDEVKRYVRELRVAEPELKRDRIGKADVTRGVRRMASNVELANSKVGQELGTQPYVIWQDLRLKEQLKLWEDTYGGEASRSEP
jgi:hypothetical protein